MLDLLMKRRSIRKYEQKAVEPEKIEQIMKAALLAPSSKKSQPWEFVVVTEPELLKKLSQSREMGAAFVKESPLAIVILADPAKSNVWVEDAAIAATLIQLEAEMLGLGSCWIQVRNRSCDEVRSTEAVIREMFKIPQHLHVASFIAMGYPAENKQPYSEDDLPENRVFVNRYGVGE
ncbi:nitroreductase family protein [Anoxynatronum sibiricum]|uniref:Nitroreductase family protein n=1 Tax=Anoxynatronum sibiricum TaxID=210623 RepID=A0ABU9VV47_9CLOT